MSDKVKCPNCGTLNSIEATFCVHCGTNLITAKDNLSTKQIYREDTLTEKGHKLLWLVLIVIAVLAMVDGIFAWKAHNKSSTSEQHHVTTSTSSSKTPSTKTAYYDKLSSADRKKIHFKFTISQNETKDNVADPAYMVSMKVTNKSNKRIKFHKDKFVYLYSSSTDDKVLSSATGTLTVKPSKTKSIDQLFDDVSEQSTLGGSVIVYLNSKNKLAYTDFVNNVATSNNLKNNKLRKLYENSTETKASTDASSYDTKSSADASTSNDSTTTQDSSSSTTSSPSNTGLTEAQAKQILVNWGNSSGGSSFGGYSIDELSVTHGDGGWGFTTPDGQSWTVRNDGSIHAPGDPIEP